MSNQFIQATGSKYIIEADVKLEEQHQYSYSLPSFTLESGAVISEHVVAQPVVVTCKVEFSNRELGYMNGVQWLTWFLNAGRSAMLFRVITQHSVYARMCIRSVTGIHRAPNKGVLGLTLEMQQVGRADNSSLSGKTKEMQEAYDEDMHVWGKEMDSYLALRFQEKQRQDVWEAQNVPFNQMQLDYANNRTVLLSLDAKKLADSVINNPDPSAFLQKEVPATINTNTWSQKALNAISSKAKETAVHATQSVVNTGIQKFNRYLAQSTSELLYKILPITGNEFAQAAHSAIRNDLVGIMSSGYEIANPKAYNVVSSSAFKVAKVNIAPFVSGSSIGIIT